MRQKLTGIAALLLLGVFSADVLAYVGGTPVATDSRIKTFVFNANDVYRLTTHYGYQLNIEFANDEQIETVSVGDRTGWNIVPGNNRLFVRAMEDKSHTNMTVVTDKRAYQFDLYSSQPGENGWDELVYVVRFYYPEEGEMDASQVASVPQPAPMMASYPAASMPMPLQMPQPMPMIPPQAQGGYAMPSMPSYQPPRHEMPQMQGMPMMPAPSMTMPPMMMPPAQGGYAMPSVPSYQPPAQEMPQMQGMIQPLPSVTMPPPMAQPAPMMETPSYTRRQEPAMPQMGMSALPPLPALPPLATQEMRRQPAYDVPPVNVAPYPTYPQQSMAYPQAAPPPAYELEVAPPPRPVDPNAPFVANHLNEKAQRLAREYPKGSYHDPALAPRISPNSRRMLPQGGVSGQQVQAFMQGRSGGLPLPSSAPGDYLRF